MYVETFCRTERASVGQCVIWVAGPFDRHTIGDFLLAIATPEAAASVGRVSLRFAAFSTEVAERLFNRKVQEW